MDYKKVTMIDCDMSCMYRHGEECTLTLDRFREHEANDTTRAMKCTGNPFSYNYESVEKRLMLEEAEKKKEIAAVAPEQPLQGEVIPPYASYEEFKETLDAEIKQEVEGYVRIGYLLKIARDTRILEESGYKNLYEFAQAEYNLDKSRVSRYIAINDRFAVNGYAMELKEEYKNFGVAKLSMMLTLPDEINEELSPNMSKSEIQAIRDEVAEEQKITPIEHMMDGETDITACAEDKLSKAILQLGESNPELYSEIYNAVVGVKPEDDMKSIMAPSGEQIYSIRIRGIGRIMMCLKDYEDTIALVDERTGEKETRTWSELTEVWEKIIRTDMTLEESWAHVYGQQFQIKKQVAPEQPKKEQKKVVKVNEQKKPETCIKKTEKTKKEEPKQMTMHDTDASLPEPQPVEVPEEDVQEKDASSEEKQQLPGQVDITDYPEVIPEKKKISREEFINKKTIIIGRCKHDISYAGSNVESECWREAKRDLMDAIHDIDLLIELEEMEITDEEEQTGEA